MSNNVNWADRQKAALQAVDTKKELKAAGTGGAGSVNVFYGTTPPKKEGNKQLQKGDVFEGKYLGSPVSQTYGNPFHKIQIADGTVIALPSAGSLNKQMATVAENADVKIIYNGSEKMTTGKFAGKAAHRFEVFASEFKE